MRHLARNSQPRRPDRQLVRLGPEHAARDADPVAEVEQLEDLEVALRQRVLPDVDLNVRPAVGDDEKVRLAEAANRRARARPSSSRAARPRARHGSSPRARSTSACTVSVRSNRADTDRRRDGPAPRSWHVAGELIGLSSRVSLRTCLPSFFRIAVQHAVDERGASSVLKSAGELDRLVDHDLGRRIGACRNS